MKGKRQMSNEFFENTKKPADSPVGRIMLWLMNIGHNRCAMWALSHIDFRNCLKIIDIGCGGGKNISNLLKLAPEAVVWGIECLKRAKERYSSSRLSNIFLCVVMSTGNIAFIGRFSGKGV
jgi:tRNA G46 methylase TrmB